MARAAGSRSQMPPQSQRPSQSQRARRGRDDEEEEDFGEELDAMDEDEDEGGSVDVRVTISAPFGLVERTET